MSEHIWGKYKYSNAYEICKICKGFRGAGFPWSNLDYWKPDGNTHALYLNCGEEVLESILK